jgi:hypothetical protein
MTTELSKLQIENPPKEKKNDGSELVHGESLTKLAGPEEVKGACHATAEAMMVKDKRKQARNGYRPGVQSGEVGQRIDGCQGSEAQAQELFAGKDCAAEGQAGLLRIQ